MTQDRLERMIQRLTRPISPALTPELAINGADDLTEIWSATEATLETLQLAPPFWAFAWPGGQALARWLLDNPSVAQGARVLALAAGAGLEAVAAAKVGAARVEANDIDAAAAVAARMNAALNGVSIETSTVDLLADPPPGGRDLILVGDAFYEKGFADRLRPWLATAAARGAEVLIGDTDRAFPPRAGFDVCAEYRAPTAVALEDAPFRDVRVLRAGAAFR